MTLLELTRAQVAEGGMPTLTVVEQFNVFEQRAAGVGACGPASLVYQFKLEGGEEALRHRVVPTVSDPAHAAEDSVCREQLLIFLAGVLAAAVRVMQHCARRLSALKRHPQCVQCEPSFQPFAQRPADYPAREQ